MAEQSSLSPPAQAASPKTPAAEGPGILEADVSGGESLLLALALTLQSLILTMTGTTTLRSAR